MSKARKRTALLSLILAVVVGLVVTMPAFARVELDDGTYLVNVTLEGGSGKATIDTPATVTVNGGAATVTVVWSSPNYDYMIVAGETYHPTNTEGNSTFEIPVDSLDVPLEVVADTTAMSVPHEIDYQIIFDASSAQATSIAAFTIAAIFFIGLRLYEKKPKKIRTNPRHKV